MKNITGLDKTKQAHAVSNIANNTGKNTARNYNLIKQCIGQHKPDELKHFKCLSLVT